VATGDSGCEAYTAIAWGVGLSHERSYIGGLLLAAKVRPARAAAVDAVIGFLINGGPDVYAEPLAVPRPEDQYRSCGVSGKGCVSEEI
jgi:hypothetical protein